MAADSGLVRTAPAAPAAAAAAVEAPGRYRILRDPWIRAHVRPYGRYFVQAMALMTLTVVINFSIPIMNRAIVNNGILAGDESFVDLMIVMQAVLYLTLILLNVLRNNLSSNVSARLLARMNSEYVSHIVNLPMRFFQTARAGEIVERIRDLERVQRFTSVELVDAVAAAVSIFSLSLLLLWIDGMIFLMFAGSAIAYLLWIMGIGLRRRQVDADRFREAAKSRAIEIGIVDAIQDIKIAGYEDRSLAGWAAMQLCALQTQLKAASIEHLQAAGGQVCNRAGMLLITLVSAREAVAGTITLGDFMITLTVSLQLYFYVNQLLEFVNKLDDVRGALRRAEGVRNTEAERDVVGLATSLPPEWQPIRFEDVSFTYPGAARPSLAGISFVAPAGGMTALVGPSGSGKSTILKLLLRLYDPAAGAIRFGNCDLHDISHALWRERIGAVMQDGALFAATIRENIVAGREPDRAWLDAVIAAACLEELIADSVEGLETPVGPQGRPLSAGEVQRILIGRALYKRPSLLLLDEATSALDGRNETSITANIKSILPEATSIVAAHRLNTIAGADQVLVMDSGRIVDRGSPSDLFGAEAYRLGLAGPGPSS